MSPNLLMVGSIPLKSVEEVMTVVGGELGPYLPAIPDGEVGERRSWVLRLSYQIFNGHIDLETIRRPRRVNGVEQLMPRGYDDVWQFKVKEGVDQVRFGNPGYRLGYAKDAVNSYFVFKTLRDKGILPADLRFQISMPMVNSVIRSLTFPDPRDLDRIRPGYEAAIAAELAAIFDAIPHRDLAIQFDCAWEVASIHGSTEGAAQDGKIATHIAPVARLAKIIPDEVALGFHFCFGTFGGWPAFAPRDLSRTVELVNASVDAAGRRVDWVHIPALDRLDESFYSALADLDVRGARIYLGLIHNMPTFARRLETARKFVPDFGLAAYCGLGRVPPDGIPKILEDHLAALQIAGLTEA